MREIGSEVVVDRCLDCIGQPTIHPGGDKRVEEGDKGAELRVRGHLLSNLIVAVFVDSPFQVEL